MEEKDGKDVAFVKIPTAHPIFVYGHSNSLFLLTLKFFFTKEEKGSERESSPPNRIARILSLEC